MMYFSKGQLAFYDTISPQKIFVHLHCTYRYKVYTFLPGKLEPRHYRVDRIFWPDKEIKFLTLCASLQKQFRLKYLYDSSLLLCIKIFLQNLLRPMESNKISYKGDIT